MIDADPQCNLTSFFTHKDDEGVDDGGDEGKNEDDEEMDGTSDDDTWGGQDVQLQYEKLAAEATPHDFNTLRNDASNPSLYTALYPVFAGDISGLVAPRLEPVPRSKGCLFLLQGSTEIVKYESPLSLAVANPMQTVTQYGAFRRSVDRTVCIYVCRLK